MLSALCMQHYDSLVKKNPKLPQELLDNKKKHGMDGLDHNDNAPGHATSSTRDAVADLLEKLAMMSEHAKKTSKLCICEIAGGTTEQPLICCRHCGYKVTLMNPYPHRHPCDILDLQPNPTKALTLTPSLGVPGVQHKF